jgi:hypothetical protein
MFSAVISLWLLPLGIALGIFIGVTRRINPFDEARNIDSRYGFYDRILTATELSLKPAAQRSPIEALQIADAAEHLQHVKAEEAVPLRIPKILAVAVIAFILVRSVERLLPHYTANVAVSAVSASPFEPLLESLPENVKALVKDVVDEHRAGTLVAGMKDTLAALSNIQQDLQQGIAEKTLQMHTSAEALKEFAEALSSVKELKPVSKAMQEGNYAKAAEAVKQPDGETVNKMTAGERNTAVKELQKAAEKMQSQRQDTLQKAAEQLGKGLKEQNTSEYKSGTDTLTSELIKLDSRQKALQNTAASLAKLAEAKNYLMKGNAEPGNMDGGKQTDKTKEPGKNWGSGSADNPSAGKQTDLQSGRQRQELTGQAGTAGDSEREKPNDNDKKTEEPQKAKAAADYQSVFPEYRKAAEAVLDTEAIPLGKRQMIRRYFTAISPE